jgi:hypothetical protein
MAQMRSFYTRLSPLPARTILIQSAHSDLSNRNDFLEIDFALSAVQLQAVNGYRWDRDTIRHNAHLERRLAEVDRLCAELVSANLSLKTDLDRWNQWASDANQSAIQASHEPSVIFISAFRKRIVISLSFPSLLRASALRKRENNQSNQSAL